MGSVTAPGNLSSAVRAQRHEPHDSLDHFPTPPWATRALCEHVLGDRGTVSWLTAWDPAAAEGCMVRPLREYFASVEGSDVHDYGAGFPVRDFLMPWPAELLPRADWIITNPPYRLAREFALRAIPLVPMRAGGVALLVRTQWLAGETRWQELFVPHRPDIVAQFAERVPMFRGRLDPHGSSATDYCWVVWRGRPAVTRLVWIPPCRDRLERADDYAGWPAP